GVKEAVDNALDACEEAGILPEIKVELKAMGDNEYKMTVEDNGPGIVRRQIPNVFGRLLYGSRFHAIRQSRGQQGIGISAVVMYGQLTTGKHTIVRSKVAHQDVAHEFDLMLNTKRNAPEKLRDEPVVWKDKEHGTRLIIHLTGRVTRGRQSVGEYIRQTAIVNPHVRIVYKDPFGQKVAYERSIAEIPPATAEVKPHPKGTELGALMKMLKATKARTLTGFLHTEFSSVSHAKAKEICEAAEIGGERSPKRLKIEEIRRLARSFGKIKLRSPDTSCLSPIGSRLIKLSMKNVLGSMRPEFYAPPVTRPPRVHKGHPFQVETGIVYGGDLPKERQVEILRFANRVPLLYQQGACTITRALEGIDWRKYGLEQRGGRGIPNGPAIIFIHVASTKIPFTSESKEAIANVQEIRDEVEKALRDCGRKLKLHLSKRKKKGKAQEKFDIVQQILPEIAKKSAAILGRPVPDITRVITKVMDIVQVKEETIYHQKTKVTEVNIRIKNYRPVAQKLRVYAILPPESLDPTSVSPKPEETKRG
ncbi:MAG: DNA topoisomerase VI subunit B, partial [Thermoplasmata archaeon]|nr:DNA topoisomerase VI subunit B [Thermoplasmata archaeon]